MQIKSLAKKQTSGFSLVEMLVVIAVIGIIAAIAVPTIGSITSQADTAKAMRNAQNLASVYISGLAAGVNFQGADKAATIADVVSGDTVTGLNQPFQGSFFGVPNLSVDEQSNAAEFLDLDASGMLVYTPEGDAG